MPTKQTFVITLYIFSYFTISIGLGFFSSYYLSSKNYNFKFPLFITSMQNLVHFILSNIVILFMHDKIIQIKKRSIRRYFLTTLPCAISAALDIGIGSYALRSVSLAYYTMIKSSSPVFVLLCGFIFGIEKPSIKLFLVVFVIGIGVFLTTIKTEMSHIKLCLSNTTFMLLFASFMGGFRWAFVQFIMQKKGLEKETVCTVSSNKSMEERECNENQIQDTNNASFNVEVKNKANDNVEQHKKINFYSIDTINSKESEKNSKNMFFDVKPKNIEPVDYKAPESKNEDTPIIDGTVSESNHEKLVTEAKYPTVVLTIRSLSIPIGCFLFVFSCIFEGMHAIFRSEFFKSQHSININVGYILLTGILTFVLLVSEFLLVSKTSVMFLSVCGIVKELMIVFISVCRKDITFERTNYVGLAVSVFGMVLYNYTRLNK